MLKSRVDDFQVDAFVPQGKFKVPDQCIVYGHSGGKEDLVFGVHSPIDRSADRCGPMWRSHRETQAFNKVCVA